MSPTPPKVFISYSHDSAEHDEHVRALADRLCGEGVDCTIDQYDPHPREPWPRWMDRQIEEADFVLVVCTEIYLRRAKGLEPPGVGLGVTFESRQALLNVSAVLAAASMTFADIVKMSFFLMRREDMDALVEARKDRRRAAGDYDGFRGRSGVSGLAGGGRGGGLRGVISSPTSFSGSAAIRALHASELLLPRLPCGFRPPG
ncbi:MAG: TIR domain-containing protein [Thermoanaerobaculia bacterium]